MKLSQLIKELQEVKDSIKQEDMELIFITKYTNYISYCDNEDFDYSNEEEEIERYSVNLKVCGARKKYLKIELE